MAMRSPSIFGMQAEVVPVGGTLCPCFLDAAGGGYVKPYLPLRKTDDHSECPPGSLRRPTMP